MKSNSVLIVGCGDLGSRCGLLLQSAGWRVTGVRRHPSRLPAGFAGHAADYTRRGSLAFIETLRPDYVLATFNPSQRSVAGYRAGFTTAMANLLAGLGDHVPRQIIAVSSTRVFAEREGGWVDESSALTTDDARATAMLEAERRLLSSPARASAVRFAGIYGAPGGRLLSRVLRGEMSPPGPLRYSNRIHRDDCAGFLVHLLQLADRSETLSPVYIGVDNEPAPQSEVERWLAARLGVQDSRTRQPPATHGTSGHKRCSNALLRASGYRLQYADYRSGYSAIISPDPGH